MIYMGFCKIHILVLYKRKPKELERNNPFKDRAKRIINGSILIGQRIKMKDEPELNEFLTERNQLLVIFLLRECLCFRLSQY